MSDVIATILLLGITVSLFSAIFLFVNRFPKPLQQSTDQFTANAVLNGAGTAIAAVKIVLTTGPAIPSSGSVYLVPSKAVAGNWQFTQSKGVPVKWGFNNSTSTWVAGESWYTIFKAPPTLPNNITVEVVAGSVLLYQVTLTGTSVNAPPTISQAWIVASSVGGQLTVGASFWVNSTMTGNLKGATATIFLGGVPGLSKSYLTYPLNTGAGTGSFHVTSGNGGSTTTPGTYSIFITGNNSAGQTFSSSVPITVTSSAGASAVTASVSITPSTIYDRNNATVSTTILNSGSSTVTVTAVTFYINATNGATWAHVAKIVVPPASLPVTVPAGQSSTISQTWLPGPNATTPSATGINLTAVTTWGGSSPAIASRSFVVSPPPYIASIQPLQLSGTPPATVNSYWIVPIQLVNLGSLSGSTVNITVYVNQTATTTWKGTVWYPAPIFGQQATSAPSYSTPAGGSVIPAGAVLLTSVIYKGPGTATAVTITAVFSITDTAWSGLTPSTLTLKATLSFTP